MGDHHASGLEHVDRGSEPGEGRVEEAQPERQRGGVRECILEEMRSKLRSEGRVGTGPVKGKVGVAGRGTSTGKDLGRDFPLPSSA